MVKKRMLEVKVEIFQTGTEQNMPAVIKANFWCREELAKLEGEEMRGLSPDKESKYVDIKYFLEPIPLQRKGIYPEAFILKEPIKGWNEVISKQREMLNKIPNK